MGYLTTLTIYNDSVSKIKKHPEEFANLIYNICSGDHSRDGLQGEQLVIPQKSYHSDDRILFFQWGNTCTDLNKKVHPAIIYAAIDEMEYRLKELKAQVQEYKKEIGKF